MLCSAHGREFFHLFPELSNSGCLPGRAGGTPYGSSGLARIMQCAVKRRRFSVGAKPTRQLSLQPVAIGAVEEVTNLLKPSVQRVALGDLAKVQAVTSSER